MFKLSLVEILKIVNKSFKILDLGLKASLLSYLQRTKT